MLTGQEKNLIILLLGNEQIIGVETMDQELRKAQEHHVGRIIHMLSHQLKRRGTMPEVEMGLTPMQKHVLTFILFETMERDLYQRDIEEEFRIRRSTASGILQLMEKNGFIYRKSVARDARLKQIIPTEKAEKLRMDILVNIQEMEKKLTGGIPKEDLEVCLRVQRKMICNLSEEEQIK